MPRNKTQPHTGDPLPGDFHTLEDFWAFWDTHSTADYEDMMEEVVEVRVDLHLSKTYCAVAKALMAQVRAQARRQGVSTATLINLWLQEKAAEAGQSG
jgi:hypothetical protein